jgi:hypothetical protein
VKLHNLPVQFDIQAVGSDRKLDDVWVFFLIFRLTETAHESCPALFRPLEAWLELRRVPFFTIKETAPIAHIIPILTRPGRRQAASRQRYQA